MVTSLCPLRFIIDESILSDGYFYILVYIVFKYKYYSFILTINSNLK